MTLKQVLYTLLIFGGITPLFAQAPTVSVDTVHAFSDTIIIPVRVSNMEKVFALSLTLNFDSNNFSFIDLTLEDEGIGQEIIPNIVGNQLKIAWFSLNPVDLKNDTLINLKFLRNDGCFTVLSWDTTTQERIKLQPNRLPI